ncbi:MAG: DUF5658 family protein [Planctomycetota bacterium]
MSDPQSALSLAAHDHTDSSRRITSDRRRRPTRMLSRYTFIGQRRGGRREGERDRIYVDRFRAEEWRMVFTLIALSTIDLALTVRHLEHGGSEANPIMAWSIEAGGLPGFALAKLLLSLVPTALLLLHIRFPLARTMLKALIVVYVLLIAWHGVVIADRGSL